MDTRLNRSMAVAYSVQRISCSSSTPVTRYSSRSTGLRTGSRKVFSRANTCAMKTPRGLVTAKISARKTKICSQPLIVISEFLRPQQGVEQVDDGDGANDEHDERLQVHSLFLLHPVAEMNIGDRRREECDCYRDPKNTRLN